MRRQLHVGFNTAGRKGLNLDSFDESVVEFRCCCRRFESVGPTVTNVEQRTTEHHSAAGRAMPSTTPQSMSWKALDWATGIRVGSPTMRLILILLANRANEKFSCYPSVRTLVTESCAARSTVLEVLKRLEVKGFITRFAQYHESWAQRSSRYLLNHPDAPHLRPGPDSGPPGPQAARGGSDPGPGVSP
jgi:Helix-turn-helix domain